MVADMRGSQIASTNQDAAQRRYRVPNDPNECIDCGVCEPECPVDAIKPDTEPGLEKWLEINTQYAQVWPNITVKREPPPDAKEWEGKPDKVNLLSSNPGTGELRARQLNVVARRAPWLASMILMTSRWGLTFWSYTDFRGSVLDLGSH
jgi:NAD-dependent dihydropyrimidine dehydrogenase PreA subunit